MTEVALSHHRRARVWLAEPPARFGGQVAYDVDLVGGGPAAVRAAVAMEVVLPHGAHAGYGLLGASVTTGERTGAAILVREGGVPFESDLVYPPDHATIGLSGEFAAGVLAGVRAAASSFPRGAVLTFDHAATAEIGSSEALFARLAVAVVRLTYVAEPDVARLVEEWSCRPAT